MSTRNARSIRSRMARKLAAYAAATTATVGAMADTPEADGAILYTKLDPPGPSLLDPEFSLDFDGDGDAEFRTGVVIVRTTTDRHVTCSYYGDCWPVTDRNYFYGRAMEGSGRWFASVSVFGVGIPYEVQALATISPNIFFESGAETPFGLAAMSFHELDGIHTGWAWFDQGRLREFAWESEPGEAIMLGDKGFEPGDTNGDGQVDLQDLNHVRNTFGKEYFRNAYPEPGDTNFDMRIDENDLNAVRNNFGAISGANPVPEPPSLLLLAAGAAGLAALRRRRMKLN